MSMNINVKNEQKSKPTKKRLYIGNLRENVTEDEIVLYLEQAKFHPQSASDYELEQFIVRVGHLDTTRRFAIINLPDIAVKMRIPNNFYILKVPNKSHQNVFTVQKSNPKNQHNNTSIQHPQKLPQQLQPKQPQQQTEQQQRPTHHPTQPKKSTEPQQPQKHTLQQPQKPQPQPKQQPIKQQQNVEFNRLIVIFPVHLQTVTYMELEETIEDPNKNLIEIKDELHEEKRKLMKLIIGDMRHQFGYNLVVWIDKMDHKIGVGSHDSSVNLRRVSTYINDILSYSASCEVDIPLCLVKLIVDAKFFRWLQNFFEQHGQKVIAFKPTPDKLFVVGRNEQSAKLGAKLLEDDFTTIVLNVSSCNKNALQHYFNDAPWLELVHYISYNYFTYVSCSESSIPHRQSEDTNIFISGFKSYVGFEIAHGSVEEFVSKLDGCIVTNNNYYDPIPYSDKKQFSTGDFKARESSQFLDLMNLISADNDKLNMTEQHGKTLKAHNSTSKQLASNQRSKTSVQLSVLKFQFLKQEYPDLINKNTKYLMHDGCLEISANAEEECMRTRSKIEDILSSLHSKVIPLDLPCLTIEFYHEKNSPFRELLVHIGKRMSCVFDVKASSASNSKKSLNVECCGPVILDSLESTLIDKLNILFDEKRISFSFILNQSSKTERILHDSLLFDITQLANKNVSVEIDNLSEEIVLRGRCHYLKEAESSLNSLFLEHLKNISTTKKEVQPTILTLESSLRDTNLSEFLKLFGHQDIHTPSHWISHQGSLRTHSNNKGSLHELSSSSSLYNLISLMVDSTWRSDVVGIGKDAYNLKHKNIKIEKIYAVENVYQYKRYMTKINEFCLQNHDKISGLSQQTQTLITRNITDDTSMLLHEINECYLFHGMNKNRVQAIIDQGFDFRLGNSKSLFGQGIYFAESATKADQYADDKSKRAAPGEVLSMFVSRVFLGRLHNCEQPYPFKRPPCSQEGCHSETCHQHPLCDSVLGTKTFLHDQTKRNQLMKLRNDLSTSSASSNTLKAVNEQLYQLRNLLFREFIVYDQSQCYPEFLINYSRID
ncbi:hypothetical protein HELRODRAFT_191235 [Helobdella robusta]|uniref:Poly [ADP-ribose] polymerase n=1 Tax=Helobdella robusta TaxID=6412 RepID=T1FSR9_HELRO|nr:hypothetical protein HELRODRAFT_191235 [Helobdella robusta]ESO06900.1 hypothetical protein HELRODRAFT_191235 [Helobdella robusta]